MTAMDGTMSNAVVAERDHLRSGVRYWLASLRAMLRFDLGRRREWAPMMVVVQTMMGAGMAILYGFFYPHITPTQALFIATGAPTLALIPLGFVMLPTGVAMQKTEGSFDYIWSLPAVLRRRQPFSCTRCWPCQEPSSP